MTAALTSLFRALELACPAEFRREYGAAMRRDFEDGVRDQLRIRGLVSAFLFACGAYADLLLAALREFTAMFFRDLTFAFRSLRKTPVFSAIVVTTLALAIAANATVFSVLRAVVLSPLPYPAADRLTAIIGVKEDAPFALSMPDFRDFQAQTKSFDSVAAFTPKSATLTGRGLPVRLFGVQTTPRLFQTLGVGPMLGRVFTPADGRAGSAPSVVISETLWRTTFASDPGAIGANVVLDGKSYRVIGVVPATLRQPVFQEHELQDESFWLPLDIASKEPQYGRGAHYFQAVGRMRPEVSLEQARADATTIFARLAIAYPADDKRFGVAVTSAYESIVGTARPLLVAIFAAVAGVLLVACANVANLLLSRAASREREFAIRSAVGASRGRLAAQLLVETFALAAIGGVAGSALAALALRAFVASNPVGLPRVYDIRFDVPAALFTLAVVALCTVVAGVGPALSLSRQSLADALKSAGRNGDASGGNRLRGALVISEVALTLALVVSSGLVLRSFFALTAQPLGFDPAGLTVANIQIPPDAAKSDAATLAFERGIEERLRALPGVMDATWSYSAPFSRRTFQLGFDFDGHRAPSGESPDSEINVIGPDYFATLRQPLVAGRAFTRGDVGSGRVAVVNEAFVRKFLSGRHRLGTQLVLGVQQDAATAVKTEIVGIARDVRTSYAAPPAPTIYLPSGNIQTPNALLLIRSKTAPRAADVGAVFASVNSLVARPKLTPFEKFLSDDTARTRLAAATLGSLAFVALALSLAGIFAVVSYGVVQRTHEFGIRMALGARAWQVIRCAVTGAMRLVGAGVLLGIVVAASTTRLLSNQLYDVAPLDPLTFGTVALAIVAAAFLAALIPASRATHVDPVVALRYE